MSKRTIQTKTLRLDKIVGGGQALGTLEDGKKCFVWGGLPGELVEVRITKKKSKMLEAVVEHVIEPSPDRIPPKDPDSYLSTSPWQIMTFETEQQLKAQLINEAFTLHGVTLPGPTQVYSDNTQFSYRNKVEFSWYGSMLSDSVHPLTQQITKPQSSNQHENSKGIFDDENEQEAEALDLAFFKRGSKGKIIVEGTSLAREEINHLARQIRDLLQHKNIPARELKTLLIRCDQAGSCVWQLYVKNEDKLGSVILPDEAKKLSAQGGEVIFSDPRSPASRITKRLVSFGDTALKDTVLDTEFRYATEGFFQVNVPVYEHALKVMREWVVPQKPTIDLYSGVGSIGLTIGSNNTALIEINQDAVREMKENIKRLRSSAKAVLAPSEKALEYITGNEVVIVDPPRAGLHADVVSRLLETKPPRIIYLSCNPVTQARDVSFLLESYKIIHHKGYNFFPRTPHIEYLVILDSK